MRATPAKARALRMTQRTPKRTAARARSLKAGGSCCHLSAFRRCRNELCSPSAFVATAADRDYIKRFGVITMIASVSRSAAIDAMNASVKLCNLAGENSFVNHAETYRAHFYNGFRAIRKAVKRLQIAAPDRLSAQKTKGFLGLRILCGEPARRASIAMRVVSLSARLACSPDGLSRAFGAHAAAFPHRSRCSARRRSPSDHPGCLRSPRSRPDIWLCPVSQASAICAWVMPASSRS